MNKLTKITILFIVAILIIFATTLLFEVELISSHISRKILVWLLLLIEFILTIQVVRIESK